jgi:cytochrome c oxidase subunit IV
MAKDGLGYNVLKIFIALFALTAIEVAWAMPSFIRDHRALLWGGLLLCAGLKAGLIFMYFMHMRFERWLVWSLILPTPLLVFVIFGYVTKDVARNDYRDYPNGMMINHEGRVVPMMEMIHEAGTHGGASGDGAGAGEATPAGDR